MVHGHPYQAKSLGYKVNPRRSSPSPKCRPHNLHTCPWGRGFDSPALHRPPDKPDVHGAPPSQDLWDTVHPHTRQLVPQTAKAKGPRGQRVPRMPPPEGGTICQSGAHLSGPDAPSEDGATVQGPAICPPTWQGWAPSQLWFHTAREQAIQMPQLVGQST